jgi:hypothetical protein
VKVFADGSIHIASLTGAQYSFDNGVTWQADSVQNGLVSGSYDVCLETAEGCQVCTTVTLANPAPVQLAVCNDTTVCENGTATLTASALGGTAFCYIWSHTADTMPSQIVNPTANQTFTVHATNEFNCTSAQQTINVSVSAPITGTISPDAMVCPGFSTTLMANGAGGDSGPLIMNG